MVSGRGTFVVQYVRYRTVHHSSAIMVVDLPMMTEARSALSEVLAELNTVASMLSRAADDYEKRNLLKAFRVLLDKADKLIADTAPGT